MPPLQIIVRFCVGDDALGIPFTPRSPPPLRGAPSRREPFKVRANNCSNVRHSERGTSRGICLFGLRPRGSPKRRMSFGVFTSGRHPLRVVVHFSVFRFILSISIHLIRLLCRHLPRQGRLLWGISVFRLLRALLHRCAEPPLGGSLGCFS